MGLLPSALLTELRKPAVKCNFIIEIGDGSGGTIKLSSEGISSLTLGYYAPWIMRWGTLNRVLSGWRGGLTAPTFSVDVDDVGGQFSQLYGRNLRGQAVTCKLISPNVGTGSYFSWFVGIVDGIKKHGSTLSIDCRQDDDRLSVPLTKAPIRNNTFSSLPQEGDGKGKSVPYVLGTHDSTLLAANGLIKCPYVDGSNFRYLVSLGWWVDVLRVFSQGVLMANPADYGVVQDLTGDGRKITLIDFVASQGSNEIIVDVNDITSPTGPAASLKQILVDLVWNDYHTASFAVGSAPIASDFEDIDDILVTALDLGRVYYIPPERQTAQAIIKAFADSYEVLFGYTYQGKLKPFIWEWRTQDDAIYSTGRVLTDADYLSEPEFYTDAESNVTRLLAKAGKRPADGEWLNQRTIMLADPSLDVVERSDTREMPWLPPANDSIGSTAYLQPSSTTSNNWTVVGAGSAHAAVAQDPLTPASSAQYIESTAATPASAVFGLTAMPDVVAVQGVTVWYEALADGTVVSGDDDETAPALYIAAVPYTTPYQYVVIGGGVSPYQRYYGGTWPINPATSAQWTQSDLNALEVGIAWQPQTTVAKTMRIRLLFVQVAYTASANVTPAHLAVPSRRANRYSDTPEMLKVQVPLEFMDLELADDIQVQDSREDGETRSGNA